MPKYFFLALLLIPLSGLANTVYRTTDENGNTVFTDSPPANGTAASRVDIRPTNTARPPENLSRPAPENSAVEESAIVSYTIDITEPANETSFPMGPGNFSVKATVSPELKKGESLQLFLDGTPRDEPQRNSTWMLTNVFRGQHDLTVGVIDGAGKTVTLSEPVRVFVHRPSSNFRAKPIAKPRPPKPQPK